MLITSCRGTGSCPCCVMSVISVGVYPQALPLRRCVSCPHLSLRGPLGPLSLEYSSGPVQNLLVVIIQDLAQGPPPETAFLTRAPSPVTSFIVAATACDCRVCFRPWLLGDGFRRRFLSTPHLLH